MLNMIGRRLLHLVPILLGITILTFSLSYLAPGDPVMVELSEMGMAPDPNVLETMRRQAGLDNPVIIQYLSWLGGMFRGDFGTSYHYKRPVIDIIAERLPATLELTAAAVLIACVASIPLAIWSARRPDGLPDRTIRILSVCSLSMPSFWLALILMYLFAYRLDLLPVFSLGNSLQSLLLPATTLAISMVGKYTQQMRAAILEELTKPYVEGARTRGIGEFRVYLANVLPNVAIAMITVIGLSTGSLLGGAAVVEYIFSWHGIGEMAIDAIAKRDYPLIQGYTIWMALVFVLVNLLTDIIYTLVNKEVRFKAGDTR